MFAPPDAAQPIWFRDHDMPAPTALTDLCRETMALICATCGGGACVRTRSVRHAQGSLSSVTLRPAQEASAAIPPSLPPFFSLTSGSDETATTFGLERQGSSPWKLTMPTVSE
eukprot:scaffold13333_cov32-Tisochrysis_lutea.AAC.1